MSFLERAAEAWGAKVVRLISHRENAVYEVRIGGQRAALRLHRDGYRTSPQILAELDWTRALAKGGFPAPAPVPMLAGDWILAEGPERASVISWVDGVPIGDGTDPLPEDAPETYFEIGRLLARLHEATIAMKPERFDRPHWDIDGLTGEDPLWGRYWEMPLLTSEQRALIETARDAARARLEAYLPEATYTLIHTDALRENVFRTPDGLALIDFDDAGFGFVVYDLAAAVTQSVDDPLYSAIRATIQDGYASLRPLTKADRESFDMFAMLRAFSALGWTIPRLAPDHPRLPKYVRRATRAAQEFLSN